jgi:Tol biopolymer transport system component
MRRLAGCALLAPLALLAAQCGDASVAEDQPPVALPERAPVDGGGRADVEAPTAEAADSAPLTACDLGKPFGAPARLTEFDAAQARAAPRLSPDELTLYFTSTGATTSSDLAMAVRAAKAAPFGAPTVLAQSTAGAENDPMVGADGLSLWFHSLRNGSADIFLATRASPAAAFGAAVSVPTVNQPTTIEANAYFRAAASELWFVSERAGSQLLDIYVSKRTGAAFAAPARVAELSSPADEFLPQPSEDGLTVLFASDRAGGSGKQDLWIARRATTAASFDAPTPLAELNSPNDEQAGWLSADGCRVWFSSGRETDDARQQLFFAERPR